MGLPENFIPEQIVPTKNHKRLYLKNQERSLKKMHFFREK
jgi:hypothetical protein